jgi:hypothetical protein
MVAIRFARFERHRIHRFRPDQPLDVFDSLYSFVFISCFLNQIAMSH